MVVCKILICFAVLAINARETQSYPNHLLSDSKKDCRCFPLDKNGIRISKLADKFGKHDRKVIYLFRHPTSGKVTIYLPNEEKQRHFPDLTVNYHESYGLPKFKNIDELFKNPKNVVTPLHGTSTSNDNNNLDYTTFDIPTDGDGDSNRSPLHITDTKFNKKKYVFKIKPESPKQFDKQFGYKDVGAGDKGKSFFEPNTGEKLVLEFNNQAPESVNLVTEPVSHDKSNINLLLGHKKNVLNDITQPLKQVKNKAKAILGHDKPNLYDLNNLKKKLNRPLHDTHMDLGHGNKMLDISDKTKNHLKRPLGNMNLLLGHDHKAPINKNTKHLHKYHNEIPLRGTKGRPIIDTYGGKTTFYASVLNQPTDEVYQIVDNPKSHGVGPYLIKSIPALLVDNDNEIQIPVSIKPASNPALDEWLLDEINNIKNTDAHMTSPQTNDLQNIKNNLLNVLEQNRLYLSDNGDLVDTNGHIIKISHLKLRKVMISDPKIYKNLLSSGKCMIPHEIPYLEALFVNLVYPPKILGLIPLRMTTLPRCQESRCADNMCSESREEKTVTLNTKTPSKLNLVLSKYTEPSPTKEHEKPIQVDSGDDQDAVQQPSVDVLAGDDEKHSLDDNDDGLGIRIIGGKPATSSGTPVSSRGRSGLKTNSLFSV